MDKKESNTISADYLHWKALKSGQKHALALLFKKYYKLMTTYGNQMVFDSDIVKDAIQELFLNIWNRKGHLGDVYNVKSYLLLSLRRQLLQQKKYQSQIENDYLDDTKNNRFSFDESQFVENKEVSKVVKKELIAALNQLSSKQREIVFLRFYQELTYKEIGELLSINEQSVKNNMQRILKKMRRAVSFHDGDIQVDSILFSLFMYYR
ncbi:sigma-70 family RNA polymerase sigma factor [Prolixibacteraceae bacterium JC049]|nr:sigma-70 family RNA polymerase sigma factor [Prolixibacteraceae bacterium JC049]